MDDILRKDLRTLQSKMTNPKASIEYAILREKILKFMRETKRTWAHSLLYLLELGLNTEEENKKKLEKLAAKDVGVMEIKDL